jgi:hypothetical protein
MPPQPIICISGPACDAKWGRAATWITTNSTFKIQVRTDTSLQTAGPVPSETTPAFTVTKVARGEGRFEITFNGAAGIRNAFDRESRTICAVRAGRGFRL